MAPVRRQGHRSAAIAALSVLFCALSSPSAHAADTPALRLARHIQKIQGDHGLLAPELLPPLLELGRLYGQGQCEYAIDVLDLALEVSRRHEGLFNPAQHDIYAPLLNCYVTLDRPAELAQAQKYVLLIDEQRYGKNDPRLLPTLEQAARRYEDVGLYLSARRLHRRAIDIGERAAGADDLSLVTPLRGMARAFRLEYAYGLALKDVADLPVETTDLRSNATFDATWGARLDRLGQLSLERAAAILRAHPDVSRSDRLDALMELGDWNQLAGNGPEALRAYREVWREASINADADTESHIDLLDDATPLFARTDTGHNLRRTPLAFDHYQKYVIDLDFTVTREGWVKDITVTESNAPQRFKDEAAADLKRTRYRPRFVNGDPVDTPGVQHRRKIYDAKE